MPTGPFHRLRLKEEKQAREVEENSEVERSLAAAKAKGLRACMSSSTSTSSYATFCTGKTSGWC